MGVAGPAARGRRGRLAGGRDGPARVRRQRQDAARVRPVHRRRGRLRRDPLARRDRAQSWSGTAGAGSSPGPRRCSRPARSGRSRAVAAPHPLGLLRPAATGSRTLAQVGLYQLPMLPERRLLARDGAYVERLLRSLVRARRFPTPRRAAGTGRRCRSGPRRTARWSTTAGWSGPGSAPTAAGTRPGCARPSASPCCRCTAPSTARSAPARSGATRAGHRPTSRAGADHRRPLPARGGAGPLHRAAARLAPAEPPADRRDPVRCSRGSRPCQVQELDSRARRRGAR